MLPAGMTSFLNKVSTMQDDEAIRTHATSIRNAVGKFKRTLSTTLPTPTIPKISPRQTVNAEPQAPPQFSEKLPKTLGRPKDSRACKICLKILKVNEIGKTCSRCRFLICEDCICYNPEAENEKPEMWKCIVCRRKLQSRQFSNSLSNLPEDEELSAKVAAMQDDQAIRTHATNIRNAVGKLKQTLSTTLLTPTFLKISPRQTVNAEPQAPPQIAEKTPKTLGRPKDSRACRICLKVFTVNETGKTCSSCRFLICEDCNCYNPEAKNEKPEEWKCIVCRRKLQSRRFSKSLSDIPEDEELSAKFKFEDKQYSKDYEGYHSSRAKRCQEAAIMATRRRGHSATIQQQDLTSKAFPISGDFYYESTNTKSTSLPSPKIDPSAEIERIVTAVRQQSSQGHEKSLGGSYVCPWLLFDAEDLNSILRRLLIHTEDTVPNSPSLITASIQRDLTDKSPTTRGLGMHVTGGRVGTFIYWIEPCGPAEKAGLMEGDWILEWNNSPLINRTFEEVHWVIGNSEPVVNLLIKRPQKDRELQLPHVGSKPHDDSHQDEGPSTSTKRKLPSTLK